MVVSTIFQLSIYLKINGNDEVHFIRKSLHLIFMNKYL